MIEEKLVPELRFPEFEGEWERKRLGDVAEITMGQSPKSKWYNEKKVGLPLIQGNADIKNRKTRPRLYTEKITKTADIGDLILTVRAPVGHIAISDHNVCIGRGVCSINSKHNKYIYNYLLKYEEKWYRYAQGSTFTAINSNDINDFRIFIPSEKEQEKIGNFFSKIDKKIELQEEVIENLEKQKKGIMQKIFNQEVRFKDENGEDYPEWESIQMKDFFTFSQGVQVPVKKQTTEYKEGLIRFIRIIDITQKDEDERYIENLGDKYYVNKKDLFMIRYGEAGMVATGYEGIIANNLFKITPIKKNINRLFFYYLFKSSKFKNELRKNTLETTLKAINFTTLNKIFIKIPRFIKEQEEISILLSLVDKRIDLEREQLENYKEYKKGLMQRMFI